MRNVTYPRTVALSAAFGVVLSTGAAAQVDQARAAQYFREAAALCEREGGRLWGVSLCGPMVFADPATKTMATNQPAPDGPWPPAMGFANFAMNWGGTCWSMYSWRGVPPNNERLRARLLMHELFHRVQPQLGLQLNDSTNDHLNTVNGRYWLQLEWRALAAALRGSGEARANAIRDALAFRAKRHMLFASAAESERVMEINEGLAQYTGTVVAYPVPSEAAADAASQLEQAPSNSTFVRSFPYPSGAAYGVLLDQASPGWTRRLRATDDLARLLRAASRVDPAPDAEAAAMRYNAAALHAAEVTRESEAQKRMADLRRRFIDGPVLVLPNGGTNSFTTDGMTPIPGVGTIYPAFRSSGEWGSLEGKEVLMSADRRTLTVPVPSETAGTTITGDGWTLTIAAGWTLRPGSRSGDLQLVKVP